MSKEKTLTPELRFPEFKNDGEWKEKILEEVLEYERPDKYIVTDTNYQKEGIPVLTANKSFILGYIKEDFDIYDNLPAIIFDDFTVDSKFADFPFKVKSSAIKILKPKRKDNLKFIYELLSQIKFDAKEHKRYYISEYQKLKLPFPSIAEQQKIASCLSSLDELIEGNSQKLDLLKDHKKGLMQNLFPQEGQKVPKYRFPEFENDGEWEKKLISDLGETINGLTGKNGEDFGTGKPYVTYKQVFDNSIIDFERCGKVQISENEKQNALQKGDILFTTSSETPNEVGIASVVVDSPKEETYLNSFCFSLRPISLEETQPQFSRYLFHSPVYRKAITVLAQGITRYNISKGAFLNLKLPIPKPLEQQKIASCLSALDELIIRQTAKIEQLKIHKKGLMQGLFPKMNK